VEFEPDSAGCRLVARGMDPSVAFAATGSPRYVASATASAAVGAAIGIAIRENQNFNDCMEARGWRIADGVPTATTGSGPMVATLAPSPIAESMPAPVAAASAPVAVPGNLAVAPHPPAVSATRARGTAMPAGQLSAGIIVAPISNELAFGIRLSPPRGVIVMQVTSSSPASMAGLQSGDVIFVWNGANILTLDDLGSRFPSALPGSVIDVLVWRNGATRDVSVAF